MVTSSLTRGGIRSARLVAAGTATRIVLTPVVMWLVLAGDEPGLATALFCALPALLRDSA